MADLGGNSSGSSAGSGARVSAVPGYVSMEQSTHTVIAHALERAIPLARHVYGLHFSVPNVIVRANDSPYPASRPGMVYMPSTNTVAIHDPARYQSNPAKLHEDLAAMMRQHFGARLTEHRGYRSYLHDRPTFWDNRTSLLRRALDKEITLITPASHPHFHREMAAMHERANRILKHSIPMPVIVLDPAITAFGATMEGQSAVLKLAAKEFPELLTGDNITDKSLVYGAHEIGHFHLGHWRYKIFSGHFPTADNTSVLTETHVRPTRGQLCAIRTQELEADWLSRQIAPEAFARYVQTIDATVRMGISLHPKGHELGLLQRLELGQWPKLKFDKDCTLVDITGVPIPARPDTGIGHEYPRGVSLIDHMHVWRPAHR